MSGIVKGVNRNHPDCSYIVVTNRDHLFRTSTPPQSNEMILIHPLNSLQVSLEQKVALTFLHCKLLDFTWGVKKLLNPNNNLTVYVGP